MASLVVSIISVSISLGSAIFSMFSLRTARNASRLGASSPWATEVTKFIVKEIENAEADDNLVRIFCTVPFETTEGKKERRLKLNELRLESQKTVFALDTLTNRHTRLQATKAARDKIDDSYWDNNDLELGNERGNAKLAEYRVKAEEHLVELRTLMRKIATHERLALMEPKSKPKQLSAGEG